MNGALLLLLMAKPWCGKFIKKPNWGDLQIIVCEEALYSIADQGCCKVQNNRTQRLPRVPRLCGVWRGKTPISKFYNQPHLSPLPHHEVPMTFSHLSFLIPSSTLLFVSH
jgi:hypothetical protein